MTGQAQIQVFTDRKQAVVAGKKPSPMSSKRLRLLPDQKLLWAMCYELNIYGLTEKEQSEPLSPGDKEV